MRTYAALTVILCLAFPGLSATHKARRPSSSKARSTTVAKKPGTPASAVRHASIRKSGKSSRSRKNRQTWRTAQTTPTPERYKEIQQALIDKGYLAGPASGVWGPDCTQALKRFQQGQNLEPSGKLDALSLISLGLGPRRESVGSAAILGGPLAGSAARAMQ